MRSRKLGGGPRSNAFAPWRRSETRGEWWHDGGRIRRGPPAAVGERGHGRSRRRRARWSDGPDSDGRRTGDFRSETRAGDDAGAKRRRRTPLPHVGRRPIGRGGAEGRDRHDRPAPVVSDPGSVAIADPDGVAPPVAIVGEPGPDGHAEAERQERLRVEGRSLVEHDFRRVVWDVDHIRLSRHDADDFRFADHLLLRRVDQRAGGLGAGAETLDRLHDVGGLLRERLAHLARPLEIIVQPLQDLEIVGEGLHALVPGAVLDLRTVAGCFPQLAGREHDVRRRGCRGQDQRDQRIRIQRNRSEQLFQVLGGAQSRQRHGGRRRGGVGGCLRGERRTQQRRGEEEREAFHGGGAAPAAQVQRGNKPETRCRVPLFSSR